MSAARLLRSLLEGQRRRLVGATVLATAANLAAAALLATSVGLVSAAALQPPLLQLTVAIVAVRALALVRAGARYGERLATHDAAFSLLGALRVRVYRWIVPASPGGLPADPEGDLLGRTVHDVDAVQQLLVAGVVPIAGSALAAVATVAAVAVVLPPAAPTLALGLVVTGVLLPLRRARVVARIGAELATRRGELTARLVELDEAAPELAFLGAAQRVADEVATDGAGVDALLAGGRRDAARHTALTLLAAGACTATVLLQAGTAVTSGALDGRLLGALAVLALTSFELAAPVTLGGQRIAEAHAAATRLLALRPVGGAEPTDDDAGARPHERPSQLSAHGLRVVRDGQLLLDDVALTLRPRRPVAVIGASGSGKSTLTHVLAGLLEPTSGTLAVDGEPADGAVRRGVVALAGQEAHVLPTTLAANLRIGAPEATDDELRAVIDRVRLGVWLRSLPAGLDTVVGEHAVGLSTGQARRIALARALLADRPVLVLDEPTADLDPLTAAQLLEDVLELAATRALLVLTHDVARLDRFVEVVVLDHGRVVERGAPGELRVAGGLYARARALARAGTS